MSWPTSHCVAHGGLEASVAAVWFWVDCVRREHHGYKFNSYPALFDALDAVQCAAQALDALTLVRKAKLAHRLFRADEHAYWPRLDIRWLSPQRFSLLFCPAWYFIGKIVYPGQVFLLVQVEVGSTWQCEVRWSAMATDSGGFPSFQTLTERTELHWKIVPNASTGEKPALDTRVLSYDTPSSQWPF